MRQGRDNRPQHEISRSLCAGVLPPAAAGREERQLLGGGFVETLQSWGEASEMLDKFRDARAENLVINVRNAVTRDTILCLFGRMHSLFLQGLCATAEKMTRHSLMPA